MARQHTAGSIVGEMIVGEMIGGRLTNARAIATGCCAPPESRATCTGAPGLQGAKRVARAQSNAIVSGHPPALVG